MPNTPIALTRPSLSYDSGLVDIRRPLPTYVEVGGKSAPLSGCEPTLLRRRSLGRCVGYTRRSSDLTGRLRSEFFAVSALPDQILLLPFPRGPLAAYSAYRFYRGKKEYGARIRRRIPYLPTSPRRCLSDPDLVAEWGRPPIGGSQDGGCPKEADSAIPAVRMGVRLFPPNPHGISYAPTAITANSIWTPNPQSPRG